MSDDEKPALAVPMPLAPAHEAPAQTVATLAQVQHERQLELQVAQQKYEHKQRMLSFAKRDWANQREETNQLLYAQLPKLIGAAVFGAFLAYIIPLGDSR